MATASVPTGLYGDTLKGLLAARRLLPVLLVSSALVYAEARLAPNTSAPLVATIVCVVFALTTPYLWRRLAPAGTGTQILTYAAISAVIAVSTGLFLAAPFGFRSSLLTDTDTAAVTLALFWVGGWGLGRDMDQERDLVRERERAEALEREAQRAQLLVARRHLDPHFLFNTLNAIAEWCREDGETAERAILQLSALLRTVLDGAAAPNWSLAKELELASNLLDLHRIRDPDAFSVQREIDPEVLHFPIPPLLLLPLVENAVKYGPGSGHHGTIALSVKKAAPASVRIEVRNSGPLGPRRAGGTGISTVEKRLALAYDGTATLVLEAQGEETHARVVLPLDTRPARET